MGKQIKGGGFTLLEVMISLAIVGGLLLTLIYTLNHHLDVAGRQSVVTTSTALAKEKMYEMEKKPLESKGNFKDLYGDFSYETAYRDSPFTGMMEISVVVRNGDEAVSLSELIRKPK